MYLLCCNSYVAKDQINKVCKIDLSAGADDQVTGCMEKCLALYTHSSFFNLVDSTQNPFAPYFYQGSTPFSDLGETNFQFIKNLIEDRESLLQQLKIDEANGITTKKTTSLSKKKKNF